jgi:hypothetical protein
MPLTPILTSLLSGSCCDFAEARLAKQEKTRPWFSKLVNLLLFRHKRTVALILTQ